MTGFLNHSSNSKPSIRDFYFEAAYGTRESQKVVTAMANEVARSLATVNDMQASVLASGRKLLIVLQNSDITYSVEDERKLVVNLQGAESDMLVVLNALKERENHAVCDSKLYGNNEEKVVKAYVSVIRQQKALIELTQDIRWEVMSHAHDYGQVVGQPMTADDLIKSLGWLLVPPIGPKVSEFEETTQYKRYLKDIDGPEKKELAVLYQEMRDGNYSNGRDIKQIKGTKKNKQKVWQARIDQNHRIRFHFKNGKATLLMVGQHKYFK